MATPSIPNYQGLELIGTGGFSRVYRARHVNTGRTFAIKLVTSITGERSNRFARFRRELALCRELYHPHIVGLVDQGECEGTPYAVFEYVDGVTLAELLRRDGPLPATLTSELMAQVLDALSCAHGAGVVHRDLKPSNIMVTRTGAGASAKVLDFGIGAFLPGSSVEDSTLTRSMETLGTPSYVSPEQLRGDPVTEQADLYAWGLVFLECLTGRPVFSGATVADLFHQHLSATEIALPAPLLRHALAKVLRSAVRKSPAQRAASAAALLAELKSLQVADLVGDLSGDQQRAGPSTSPEPTWVGTTGPATRRQITSLSCAVGIVPCPGVTVDPDVMATLLADQVASCAELCAEFGGRVTGVLGSQVLVHFGAHEARGSEPRLAARTAFHVVEQLTRRSRRLEKSAGLSVEVRAGLDVGVVLALRDGRVMGLTDAVATRLADFAQPGTILASDAARQLLSRYVEVLPDAQRLLPGAAGLQSTHVFASLRDDTTGSLQAQLDGALIGRREELRLLSSLLDSVAMGSGSAVLLTGEPGIGKSRLLRELRHEATRAGWDHQEARCLPEHANSALHPFLDLLKRQLGLARAGTPADSAALIEAGLKELPIDLASVVPVLCSWFGQVVPERYTPSQHSPARQKELLLEVIRCTLERSSQGRPLLLLLEDVHWADPTTLEFVSSLLGKLEERRMLLALSTRFDPGSKLPESRLRRVHLARLEPSHTATLAEKLTQGVPLSNAAVAVIAAQTDGVPLFVEEYTRSLLEAGALQQIGQSYELARGEEHRAHLPVTLRALLSDRLDRAGASRETVQLAAAIGRDFDAALLSAASGRPLDELQLDLDRLLRAELVQRSRPRASTSFAFRHALVRDAAYDSLPRPARERAHRRIAETLEAQFPELVAAQPSEVARHLAGAGAFARAAEHGARAAELSLARSANEEAAGHARLALSWLAELSPDATAEAELRLQVVMSQALMGTQGWAGPDVKAAIDRARQLLARAGRGEHHVATLWSLAAYHHTASNRAEFRQIIEELRAQASERSAAMIADSLHCVGLWCEADYARAEFIGSRALDAYDAEKDCVDARHLGFDCRVLAWSVLGLVRAFTHDLGHAEHASAEAIAWARKLRHVPSLGIALLYAAVGHAFLEQRSRAREAVTELLELAQQYGLPALQAYGFLLFGWATGDASRSPQILTQLRQMGCRLGLPFYTSLLADEHARAGRREQAIACLDECLALCEETGEWCLEAELYRRRAEHEAALGTSSERRCLESLALAADRGRRHGMPVVELKALLALQRHGQPVLAARLQELRDALPQLSASYGGNTPVENHAYD